MNILSGAPASQIVQWIEDANAPALSKLPKIGKKSTEQIVLTLQGHLVRSGETGGTQRFTARSQIVSALVNLGFRLNDVEKVVDQMAVDTVFEAGLRQGLAGLTA